MTPIGLLIVDDHAVVRKGLIHVLMDQPEIEVLGEAESGEEALFKAKSLRPNVVLMDVKMDGLGGVRTTKLLVENDPDLRIVGLSTFADQKTVRSMIDAGASGFLEKSVSAVEIVSAIKQAHEGEIIDFVPSGMPSLNQPAAESKERFVPEVPQLSAKQKDVLRFLTKGLTNPEIAEQLGLSVPTARYHVSVILQKLEVTNRSEAAVVAIRENLVD